MGAGLLAGVLSWLLWVHLPAKDKQLQTLLEGKDRQIEVLLAHKWAAIEKMTEAHSANIRTVTAEFRSVISETVRHCEMEITRIMEWAERGATPRRDTEGKPYPQPPNK